MFAAVFPIAPALALVNNLMEIKVDFLRLSNCRRPDLVDRSSLNGWITCLTILGFTSVFTNSFLLCLVSKNIHSIVPTQYLSMVQTDFSRFVLLVIVEHSLLALNVLLSNLIEDVPRWVQEMQAQEAERIRKKLATERLVGYKYVYLIYIYLYINFFILILFTFSYVFLLFFLLMIIEFKTFQLKIKKIILLIMNVILLLLEFQTLLHILVIHQL